MIQKLSTDIDSFADLVNPPLTYEHYDKDIPKSKIYGTSKPFPEQLRKQDVTELATSWINSFNQTLKSVADDFKNIEKLDSLFLQHSLWRDHLSLTWDFHTWNKLETIKSKLSEYQPEFKLSNFKIDKEADKRYPTGVSLVTIHEASDENSVPIEWVQVYVTFQNEFGVGKGLVRLISVADTDAHTGNLKVYTIYTALEQISGNEERLKRNRPQGVEHGQHLKRESWLEQRSKSSVYSEEKQPTVVIVGGGQGGLTTAARLKTMGVSSLIVEKNPKIGDNWRNRYKFLVLHDPVWYDHLPYIPFPDTWPIYTPKDKIGDWFDQYAKSMELDYWTNKTVSGAEFNDSKSEWQVKIIDNETNEVSYVYPKHVIMATGHSGEPNIPSFKNQDKFKGKLVHSSKHDTGKEFEGQNAIVVGCCNSAHDIAQDFYEQGANVTVIQRSSTCVIKDDIGLKHIVANLYDENGPKVETADLISHSMPIQLTNLMMQQQYRATVRDEKESIEGLKKIGFKFDAGYGSTGLFGKYYRRGGGYYIDVGCSKLLIDGKIKLKQGSEIKEFTENGVIFEDGSKIDNVAIVVLATGYSNMKDTAIKIFGSKVGDKLKPIWGLDEEGEFKTIYRDSGHKNFWYMGGNLALARYYSKRLALRIIAQERGLISA